MRDTAALLLVALTGCLAADEPPDAEPPAVHAEPAQTKPAAAPAWTPPPVPDSVRTADSLRMADEERRRDLYEDELDSLLAGHGPRRLTARRMRALLHEVTDGRYRLLHGAYGPGASDRYDFNGDRLADRYVYTWSRTGMDGVVYTQRPGGGFTRAGPLRLDGAWAICPGGEGAAEVYDFSNDPRDDAAYGQVVRVTQGAVTVVREDRIPTGPLAQHLAERTVPLIAAYERRTEQPRAGCYRACSFAGGCEGTSRRNVRADTVHIRVPVRADSFSVRLNLFSTRGVVRWRLADPRGRTRWRDSSAWPDRGRAVFRAGSVRPGTWTLHLDALPPRDDVDVTAQWWDVQPITR